MTGVFKDEILVALAGVGNVARFASFAPDGTLRHSIPAAPDGATILEVVTGLLAAAPAGTLNVRTFRPEAPEGNPFIFGLPTAAAVTACVTEHLAAGLHVIVNETIPLHDGGIGGGVCQDGVVELVPGTTPRGVENSDPASMPAVIAAEAIRLIYGVDITDALDDGSRTEFSIHPYRCGTRNGPLLVWERRQVEPAPRDVVPSWPNALSRFCLLYTSPSPRDGLLSRMPSSA